MTALDKQAREWMVQDQKLSDFEPSVQDNLIAAARFPGDRVVQILARFATQVREQSKWVKVSEQLPPVGKLVWVSCGEVVQEMAARLEGKGFACEDGYEWSWADDTADNAPLEVITHWQPLPAPPETTEQDGK